MARGVNKVIIIGNLGQNPELRYFNDGTPVANFSVATSESWKDKQTGQPQERTEWHRITCTRRLAEIAGEYLHKGSKVYIEGSLHTRKWQDNQGQDRYTTEIRARELQFLDPAGQRTQPAQQDGFGGQPQGVGFGDNPHGPDTAPAPQQRQPQQGQPPAQGHAPPPEYGNEFDDDIPF